MYRGVYTRKYCHWFIFVHENNILPRFYAKTCASGGVIARCGEGARMIDKSDILSCTFAGAIRRRLVARVCLLYYVISRSRAVVFIYFQCRLWLLVLLLYCEVVQARCQRAGSGGCCGTICRWATCIPKWRSYSSVSGQPPRLSNGTVSTNSLEY